MLFRLPSSSLLPTLSVGSSSSNCVASELTTCVSATRFAPRDLRARALLQQLGRRRLEINSRRHHKFNSVVLDPPPDQRLILLAGFRRIRAPPQSSGLNGKRIQPRYHRSVDGENYARQVVCSSCSSGVTLTLSDKAGWLFNCWGYWSWLSRRLHGGGTQESTSSSSRAA